MAAEKHAENLAKLAQELEGWVFEHQRSLLFLGSLLFAKSSLSHFSAL